MKFATPHEFNGLCSDGQTASYELLFDEYQSLVEALHRVCNEHLIYRMDEAAKDRMEGAVSLAHFKRDLPPAKPWGGEGI